MTSFFYTVKILLIFDYIFGYLKTHRINGIDICNSIMTCRVILTSWFYSDMNENIYNHEKGWFAN